VPPPTTVGAAGPQPEDLTGLDVSTGVATLRCPPLAMVASTSRRTRSVLIGPDIASSGRSDRCSNSSTVAAGASALFRRATA
jgi:hypothetical protein